MLNPFVILAIFVAVIYSLFLLYPMMNQEREDTDLVFEEVVTVKNERNPWFGNLHHFSSHQTCQFDDINLFEISLSVNCLYGDLTFLNQPKRALRNEHYHQETRDYLKSNKSVKIFLTTMVGDVEVVRG